jgi:uncharacterized FAD-dependent dehydrogenase
VLLDTPRNGGVLAKFASYGQQERRRSGSPATMIRINELRLPLEHPPEALPAAVANAWHRAGHPPLSVFKRSHDARKKNALMFIYSVDEILSGDEASAPARTLRRRSRKSADARHELPLRRQAPASICPRPVVVGFGPAGIFAALVLAQMGFRPIVLERGKAVRERTKDTWGLWRNNQLDPESNVQFGEGGAGTFSDGKLYSQIKDPRHLGRKVLTEFVKAGAPEEILYVAKPHIGTFRLVSMVERMRREIESLGGEIRFQSRVTGLHIEDGQVAASCWPTARKSPPSTSCWRSATAPATPSPCCTPPASSWKPSRSPSVSASSTRNR